MGGLFPNEVSFFCLFVGPSILVLNLFLAGFYHSRAKRKRKALEI